jgi:hypothetical protein
VQFSAHKRLDTSLSVFVSVLASTFVSRSFGVIMQAFIGEVFICIEFLLRKVEKAKSKSVDSRCVN